VRRTDDTEAVVRSRLEVYDRQTRPLVEYYQARPTYREVDGAQGAEQVTAALEAALDGAQGLAKSAGMGQPA
jgi:adenylate kinase